MNSNTLKSTQLSLLSTKLFLLPTHTFDTTFSINQHLATPIGFACSLPSMVGLCPYLESDFFPIDILLQSHHARYVWCEVVRGGFKQGHAKRGHVGGIPGGHVDAYPVPAWQDADIEDSSPFIRASDVVAE